MNSLKELLWEYFGQQNEIAAGVRPKPEERIEKPEALRRYEISQSLGIPYVDGGVQEQPYLWIQEHGVIRQFLIEWAAVEAAQREANNPA